MVDLLWVIQCTHSLHFSGFTPTAYQGCVHIKSQITTTNIQKDGECAKHTQADHTVTECAKWPHKQVDHSETKQNPSLRLAEDFTKETSSRGAL